jgi:polygalacturonase
MHHRIGFLVPVILLSAATSITSAQAAGSTHRPDIPQASGSGLAELPAPRANTYDIAAYGASTSANGFANQQAIDAAITAAAEAGGGTVVIPAGTFKSYTIHLKSRVGLHLAAGAVLQAAVAGTDGGAYDAPEQNIFVGLQDQGHSHWANSLLYGEGIENVMISGPGMIDGSYLDSNAGTAINVLSGSDPAEVTQRTASGTAGGANKAIALKNARNIVFRDFRIKNGGHFAILGTGIVNWTIDNLLVDTNRDALDVDASQNVTVRNSVFNSLTDDAIVLKASFGLGRYFPTRNVLVENCTVSGYDAGSVLAGTPSANKIVATDQDGPTARVKLGTEGSTGFDTITIRKISFRRSRGFALESVDGAELQNIIFEDSSMDDVSSSPIFIRLGDRGRAPVSGNSATDESVAPSNNVRLDERGWILPDMPQYSRYPALRYIPSYDKSVTTTIGNAASATSFSIVNAEAPTKLNAYAVNPTDPLHANAVGVPFARISNIRISGIKVTNADPRYPILLAGLVDHPLSNVSLSHISVQYRGGITMQHAIEQRILNRTIRYTAYQAAEASQTVPFLVNTFFAKNEALLPRISWNPAANKGKGAWQADPYNVPEMPREYPEPSIFGILPAYGLYARHVSGLSVEATQLGFAQEDERPAVVLDDVTDASFTAFKAAVRRGTPTFVTVRNTRKRPTDLEYLAETPYRTTAVSGLSVPTGASVVNVTVSRPAPGTPPDSLYTYPSVPDELHPYAYAVSTDSYACPDTVFPGLACR